MGHFLREHLNCDAKLPKHVLAAAVFCDTDGYLHLDKDVRGQCSTVGTVRKAGCHSSASLFPLGSGRLVLRDQPNHSLNQNRRVQSCWASQGLHHTIVSALPLSSNQG